MRASGVLRVLAGLFLLAVLIYLVGPFVRPDVFRETPFVERSVVKVALLGLCCLHASGRPGRARALIAVATLAHLVSIGVMALFLAKADVAGCLGDGPLALRDALVGAMVLDGVICLVLGVAWILAGSDAGPVTDPTPLVAAETRLRAIAGLFALLFLAGTAYYAWLPTHGAPSPRELPFISNSAVMTSTFAMLLSLVAWNPRRHVVAGDIAAVGGAVGLVASLVLLPGASASPMAGCPAGLSTRTLLLVSAGEGLAVALVLTLAVLSAWRRRHDLEFLRPIEFRGLCAMAEVLVGAGPGAPMSPEDVAKNIDRHLAPIRAHRIAVFRASLFFVQLAPLFRLRPPLSEIEPATRETYLKRRFGYDPPQDPPKGRIARFMKGLLRTANQLVYIGWYGDPRVHPSIDYVPFSRRPVRPEETPPGRAKSTTTLTPPGGGGVIPTERIPASIEVDYCVVGSGAAGSTIAWRLGKRSPKPKILLLERGKYVEPKDFTEDELEMVGRLYADGVMQQTEDVRMTILQGSCVGGGTTVNNGVIFDLPDAVLSEWNSPTYDANINATDFRASQKAMRAALRVQFQRPYHQAPTTDPANAWFLSPSSFPFFDALRTRRPAGYAFADVVEANIENCLGHGYENLGDAYGRKLGTIETILKEAVRDDGLEIWAEAEVDRIHTVGGSSAKVTGLTVALADGRRVEVKANKVIVCAGPVASSWLLLRNGIRVDGRVGRGFCANLGTYLTCVHAEKVHSERGLQISHAMVPAHPVGQRPPYVLETWFNPPAIQSANMPGWFEDHRRNMGHYANLSAVGVLVATEPTGVVRPSLTGGPDVKFTPSANDLRRLVDGLIEVGDIALGAGAERVMANTWRYREFTTAGELAALRTLVTGEKEVALGTGHPQGGNPMSRAPGKGVVDDGFRVKGYQNLYVCDASVFPSAVGVNPQMTVFALAHYASSRI